MRFSFSAEFLKVRPPATNFGEAWENLCLCLLRADTSDSQIMRLAPPDRGIDILRQRTRSAYQCKSSERGIFGTIDAQSCIDSFERAINARGELSWKDYSIAINAPLTGVGLGRINECSTAHGVSPEELIILPPEHWNTLCERHESHIRHLFDFRVFVTETQVIEALQEQRYYPKYIKQAEEALGKAPLQVSVTNNRTPVELVIPFSGDLTIEQLLDVTKSFLGVTTEWANFSDLQTSCGPSLSMAIDRVAQPFKAKLSELSPEQLAKLQLWIKLVWRDGLQTKDDHFDGSARMRLFRYFDAPDSAFVLRGSERERGKMTVDRMEAIIQTTIWRSLSRVT